MIKMMKWFSKKRRVRIGSLVIPCDLHTHLLPGVDDGRFTSRTAAAMLEKMYARGTRRVCLTPHMMAGSREGTEQGFRVAHEQMLRSVRDPGLIPATSLGAEYMIDESFASRVGRGAPGLFTAVEGRPLVEMSWYGPSPWLFEVVEGLSLAGMPPVLAHPERYPYMCRTMNWFDRLHDMGCGFQLNLLSTAGVYGTGSKRIMNYLFERSWYNHVGTDVHSPEQYERIMNSHMDEKTALDGEHASLWSFAATGDNI